MVPGLISLFLETVWVPFMHEHESSFVDCRGAVASVRESHTVDLSSIPVRLILHHGDDRGRHAANHNLLPDMHLGVPVLRVTKCHESRLVKDTSIRVGNR